MLLMFCRKNKDNKKVGIQARIPTLIFLWLKKFYRTAIKIITGFIEFFGVTFYIMNVTPKM